MQLQNYLNIGVTVKLFTLLFVTNYKIIDVWMNTNIHI